MVNSRDKGARLERSARDACRLYWAADDCVRTAQVTGKESSDLTRALKGGHLEVKGRAAIAALRFLDQAKRDAKEGEIPVVLMKEDRGPWVVMVEIERSPEFAERLVEQRRKRSE